MPDRSDATEPLARRRTLAAIVFTDVASFSARVQEDEDHTLHLVRRDFRFMEKVCLRTSGQVLKNTGDGLLMFFNSVVEAVRCALEIQQAFAKAAVKMPPADVLMHRIGIHLGDVVMDGGDVMGDGVNIAARIQAEAEPGGICISQTVYDVVKGRVGIHTTYLGPRDLKNIREAVPVYAVVLAAQSEIDGQGPRPRVSRGPKRPRPKALWLGVAGAVALGLAVGGWLLWGGEDSAPGPAGRPGPVAGPTAPPRGASAAPMPAVKAPGAGAGRWVFEDAESADRLTERRPRAASRVVDGEDNVMKIDFAAGRAEDWGEYGPHRIVTTIPPAKNYDISAYNYLAFRVKADRDMTIVVMLTTLLEPQGPIHQPHFSFSGYARPVADQWRWVALDLSKLELAVEGPGAHERAGKPSRSMHLTALKLCVHSKDQQARVLLDDVVFLRDLPAELEPYLPPP